MTPRIPTDPKAVSRSAFRYPKSAIHRAFAIDSSEFKSSVIKLFS